MEKLQPSEKFPRSAPGLANVSEICDGKKWAKKESASKDSILCKEIST